MCSKSFFFNFKIQRLKANEYKFKITFWYLLIFIISYERLNLGNPGIETNISSVCEYKTKSRHGKKDVTTVLNYKNGAIRFIGIKKKGVGGHWM